MEFNFKKIIAGIRSGKYRLIGSGSSRRVYDLNNGYVIKVAKDIRGVFQNQTENTTYLAQNSNFFAPVVAISEDYKLLIMPKARKIKYIDTVCKYYNVKSIRSLIMLDTLNDDITRNSLGKSDLTRVSSWGLINDVPLLIDYGLTHSIFKKYYGVNLLFKNFKKLHYS